MSFRRRTAPLLADENDALAKEIDPSGFCYAVLQTLRLGDEFSEQDFQAFVARGSGLVRQRQPEVAEIVEVQPPRRRRRPGRPPVGPGGIRYAGTEDEEEAMAEAERVGAPDWGQEDVYGDADDEEERYLPARRGRTPKQAGPDTITLTASQLQGMLAEATRRAILATASAPQPAAPIDEDDPGVVTDDDVLGDEVPVTIDDEPTPAYQIEDADKADEEARGRDGSGRFVPGSSRSKR